MNSRFLTLLITILYAGLLSGCAEIELASHVAKKAPIPATSKSKGTFKVGSSYKVAGQWYKPRETYSFEQTGVASWYGPNFHGKKTANGETFDMYEITAAHKTLQMPSLIRVTNLENGRSIIARVNDRGPFSKNRILDVSKRGAELLGFKNQGTARVKIQVLAKESRHAAAIAKQGRSTRGMEVAMNERNYQPASHRLTTVPSSRQPTRQPDVETHTVAALQPVEAIPLNNAHASAAIRHATQQQAQSIYVQAASFGDPVKAKSVADTLKDFGDAHVQRAVVNGRNYFRVRIGPLQNEPQANQVVARLASAGRDDAIVVTD
ncbi:MAG: septal ring lytic transglycosylase RlpA family protein [Rhodospirillales bacterium]|nr:septal ring lytic transglycosylase RlpA family protein [Alphaproteobacteria bacterium]USO06206.1 MAG: septal ring lytic transglycosylase RlpA family protein [Rhodospirillales bacterium]